MVGSYMNYAAISLVSLPLGCSSFYLTVPKPGSNVMASESLLRFNGLLGTSMSRHLGFVFSLEVSYRL